VTSAQGAIVCGAADRIFYALSSSTSLEPQLIKRDFGGQAPPYDLIGIGQLFALRYAGQLRIDTDDSYTFAVDVGPDLDDYSRLVIDGVPVAGRWPAEIDQPTATIPLAPGWHDLQLDYASNYQTDRIALTIAASESPAAPIASDHLRPVRARGLLASALGPTVTLANPGTTAIPFAFTTTPDTVVDALDLAFNLGTTPRTGLTLQLAQPAGTDNMPLPPTPAYESSFDYMPDRTSLAGNPLVAAWQAVFTDTGASGSVSGPVLTASYHGGPLAPFGQTMTYISPPHATSGAVSIDAITVTADLRGATLAIDVRTAADNASLDAAPWTAVANGDAPPVAAGAVVQYRLTIVSDGWAYPTVDTVEVDYTTR
jgi:hypothetical protein